MSLDVMLHMPGHKTESGSGIFVRENGQVKEISREEWDEKFPGKEPFTGIKEGGDEVYSANITHNLYEMAEKAGIGEALWRPEEIFITRAYQLIQPLNDGLARLRHEQKYYEKFNPSNGWGTCGGLVQFVQEYLTACERYPDAEVSVSR